MRDIYVDGSALCGAELIRYDECDSTNTRAREYAALIGKEAVFLADRQSAGRGRRGRSFISENGGIYISFLYFPEDGAIDISGITARAATLAARAIESCTDLKIDIKWVNDLYVNGKKIAGILTEGEFDERGNLRYYVVGMGINVYKIDGFDSKMPVAATIEELASVKPDIEKICVSLIRLMRGEMPPAAELLSEYRERCILIGRRINVRRGDEEHSALAIGVNEDYSLSVKLDSGEVRALNSGEVSCTFSN